MTLAASISSAGRPTTGVWASLACSLGSQVAISPLARSYAGWRLRVVYASAQVSVTPALGGGGGGRRVRGCDEAAAARARVVRGGNGTEPVWDWQHDSPGACPPQQPLGVLTDWAREAASDLQNSVLLGSARHCAQEPGPEAHPDGRETGGMEIETSPSDGGGVNWSSCLAALTAGTGRLRLTDTCSWCCACSCSAAISAQIHGVPSEQKPHGSAKTELEERSSARLVLVKDLDE